MDAGFWAQLPRPFAALAPMEDVTDTVFRQMVGKIGGTCLPVGRPDVYFTEFTNVEGICHALEISPVLRATPSLIKEGEGGRFDPVLRRLIFSSAERPIVAQIWGTQPQKFYEAAKVVAGLGFDGIDVNLGCPQKDILKQGACAAMIGDKARVGEILAAVSEAGLPVSVKTRLGIKKIITEEWIGWLLEQNPAAVTVHLRTAAEMSAMPAHWEEMGKIIKLRNSLYPHPGPPPSLGGGNGRKGVLVIGNGDVKDWLDGVRKCEEYGGDGFMIGRGILVNPAAFDKSGRELSRSDRIKLLLIHLNLWHQTWGEERDFQIMKKFVKAYINGFEGARELRAKMMAARTRADVVELAA